MAKKKKRPTARKRTAARRKTAGAAKRAGKRAAKRPTRRPPDHVDLKTLRATIDRDAKRLERMQTRDPRAAAVRRQLEVMMSDLDSLCDPNNPDGCGPDMVFPRESA